MINGRPVVLLDTSVHNRLLEDGRESEHIFAAFAAGYYVRLSGISIEELMSTKDQEARRALLGSAERLLHGPSDCLHAHDEILRLLILAHDSDPKRFSWSAVNVRAPEYATELSTRRVSDNDLLAAKQWQHMRETKKQFEDMWTSLRPLLEEVFLRHENSRPLSLQEVLPDATGDSGLMWGIAKGLYDKIASNPSTDLSIRDFVNSCPPFRCILYAFLMTWYDRSLRKLPNGEKFHAGRNDQFEAIYLPYIDLFLTAEKKGEQERCLAEIARLVHTNTKVQSYDDFCAGLMLPKLD